MATKLRTAFILISFCIQFHAGAQPVLEYADAQKAVLIGNEMQLARTSANISNDQLLLSPTRFYNSEAVIPFFGVSDSIIWARFTVQNNTKEPSLMAWMQYTNITNIHLYTINNGSLQLLSDSEREVFPKNENITAPIKFNLELSPGQTRTYYMRIDAKHPVVLAFFVGSNISINTAINRLSFILGAYLGILLSVIFYNLFLFISIRDRNYFLYVLYIFLLGLAQYTLAGFAYKYLWYNSPAMNSFAVPVTTSLAAIFGIIFAMHLMRTREFTPITHKVYLGFICFYSLAIIFSLADMNDVSYFIININSLFAGATSIFASIYIARKGYRPAFFFFISWISFCIGLVIFSLRNLGLVPSNDFTTYVLYLGSAIETILLSVALADRINTMQKEKELSQNYVLQVSLEKEMLIKEQNISLEQKVHERTRELERSNLHLGEAIFDLKSTQAQLVESAKMASLGQLTAGVAHEINNPINFVKANIKPLKMDLDDIFTIINKYEALHAPGLENIHELLAAIQEESRNMDLEFLKNEINQLIGGINDGAERTAEIVRSLRTFSRLDESELKSVKIYEGIDSTLLLLSSSIPGYIHIIKDYQAHGEVECYPGKLNQVLMNMLNNAVQAITFKKEKNNHEYITISTKDVDGSIRISIKDTGLGITPEVRSQIFNPFFTTKDVGSGNGLGLSIVFKIIEMHKGKIEIESEGMNKGADFIITLPHIQPLT
ncbi:MAG: 7TM diverse intracellular signaling domain-containing protein [Chitinophagaceae bacterium]